MLIGGFEHMVASNDSGRDCQADASAPSRPLEQPVPPVKPERGVVMRARVRLKSAAEELADSFE